MMKNTLFRTAITLVFGLSVTLANAAEPIVQVPPKPPISADQEAWLDQIRSQINNINTEQLVAQLAEDPMTYVVDVRSVDEITRLGGQIKAPRRFVVERGWLDIRADLIFPNKDVPIVVYCGVNQRSPLAAKALMDLGYTNVMNYTDGYFEWANSGHPIEQADADLESFLYRRPMKVADNVYSAIGATQPGTYANSGHNNNLSFVITNDGVLVMNSGDNYLLAQALHDEIKLLTDQPVKYVVLENAQGHAMLGSKYWKEQGAEIIAHVDAVDEIDSHGEAILNRMKNRAHEKAYRTEVVLPDISFEDEYILQMGDTTIEVRHYGPAHSPGDISVWLPAQKLMISGDAMFNERMLPIFDDTDTAGWLETWEVFEALAPEVIIPGHGHPTDMATVRRFTRDYLAYMRDEIAAILDEGGSLDDAVEINQSQFVTFDTYDELHRVNAARIFQMMEFEF